MDWPTHINQPDYQNYMHLRETGVQLSIALDCPVHYPAFGKRLFECACGVTFPLYVLDGGNFDEVIRLHKEFKNGLE